MTDEPGAEKEPRGGTLSKFLALQGRLGVVEEGLEHVTTQVAEVADLIEHLAEDRKQSKPAPAWWPTMSDEERDERWPQFTTWLRDVLAARYPEDARRLSWCWAKHPPAVDALTAAWLTWQAAYLNRAADARDGAAWQTQWKPLLIDIAGTELAACRDDSSPNDLRHHEAEPLWPVLLESFS